LLHKSEKFIENKMPTKNPEIAALFEFFPGLIGFLGIGHMFNGNFALGLIVLVSYWILLFIEAAIFLIIIPIIAVVTLGVGLIFYILAPVALIFNLIILITSSFLAHYNAKTLDECQQIIKQKWKQKN